MYGYTARNSLVGGPSVDWQSLDQTAISCAAVGPSITTENRLPPPLTGGAKADFIFSEALASTSGPRSWPTSPCILRSRPAASSFGEQVKPIVLSMSKMITLVARKAYTAEKHAALICHISCDGMS